MSHKDYSPALSGTFARSTSIDYTIPSNYPPQETRPNMTSDQVVGLPPVLSDVRPAVKSSNQITDGMINNSSWDPTGGQPQGFSDLMHNNNSGYAGIPPVESNSEDQPPSLSDVAHRDKSNNGGSDAIETVNAVDYAGISLVGKRFKLVNSEAYYVEKDDQPTDFY